MVGPSPRQTASTWLRSPALVPLDLNGLGERIAHRDLRQEGFRPQPRPHAVGKFRIVVRIGLGAVSPNPRRLIRMTVLASDSRASTSATGAAQLIHINEYGA